MKNKKLNTDINQNPTPQPKKGFGLFSLKRRFKLIK